MIVNTGAIVKPESPIASTADQTLFVRHNFDNLQALIRFSDTKAAALVTLMVFLGASGLQVSKEAIPAVHFSECYFAVLTASSIFVGAVLAFVISLTICVWTVQTVLRPRGARHYKPGKGESNLMWQDHIASYGDNAAYFKAVSSASPGLLLRNVSDQVFELAHISKEKMNALHWTRRTLWWGFWSWLMTIVSAMLLVRWK
jgi:hypothetical protein